MRYKKLTMPEKWLKVGIPILFIVGSIFHYIYDLTGQNELVGLLAPTNESIWEHTKMLVLPMICWWSIYYFVKGNKYNIDKEQWFAGMNVAIITSVITMIAFYYTYTGALGVESLIVDIFDLLLSIAVGQCLGLHVYRYGKGVNIWVSIAVLIFILGLFVAFTVSPPNLPIFIDNSI